MSVEDSDQLIHTDFHIDKLGYTLGGLLCKKCFLQEHGPANEGI